MKVIPIGEPDPDCSVCYGKGKILMLRLEIDCHCMQIQQLITEEGEGEFDGSE